MTISGETLQWMDLQVNRCSKCGSCRDACPVFKEMLAEGYAPRARVQLIKYWLENKISISDRYAEIMNMCLVCQNCTSICPSGVRAHELVLNTRRAINKEKGMDFTVNVALSMMKSPFRQKIARKGIEAYNLFLQKPLRSSGALKFLPGKLGSIEAILPDIQKKSFRQRFPQVVVNNKEGKRVVYFTGCMTELFYPEIGEAVVKVLKAAGYNVYIPNRQVCCGFPYLIYGNEGKARELAERNIAEVLKHSPDYIITDCASCGEGLKHYDDYFTDIDGVGEFSSKAQDISIFLLNNTSFEFELKSKDIKVTYHDPCHLKRGQEIYNEPRKVIQRIPGVQFVEMDKPDRCCGGAGTFNLTRYEISMDIGSHKLADINNTGAEIVITGCPACRTQINHLIEQYSERRVLVKHPVELLANSLE